MTLPSDDNITRLLEGDGSPFERRLLESVIDESPSAALDLQMRQALGLPVGAGPSAEPVGQEAVPSLAPSPLAQGLWVKLLLGGVVAGAAVMAVAGRSAPGPDQPTDVAVMPPASLPQVPALPAGDGPAASQTVRPSAPSTPASGAKADTDHLREEIRLLDAVRSAMGSGDLSFARGLLDDYERRFDNGALRVEAQALRVSLRKQRAGRVP